MGKKGLLILFCFCMVISRASSPTQAQHVGNVYFSTAEPLPGDWQGGWGETADIIWELDTPTKTVRELLRIEPHIEQTARETFSEQEFQLLAEAESLTGSKLLDSPLFQGLETIALLDAERLLVVTTKDMRHSLLGFNFYGFYEFQILHLVDGSLTPLLTLDFQHYEGDERECFGLAPRILLGAVRPNPTQDIVAFTVIPENAYGTCDLFYGETYLVDYAALPAQVEVLPAARVFSWSPDGAFIAYGGVEGYYVRSTTFGAAPIRMTGYDPESHDPLLLTWLNSHTILYQYKDKMGDTPERGLYAYDIASGSTLFLEELDRTLTDLDYLTDGQSFLVYSDNERGNIFLTYTPESGLSEYQTVWQGYLNRQSKFSHLGFLALDNRENKPLLVVSPDLTTSWLDLSPFIPAGHRLGTVLLGPSQ